MMHETLLLAAAGLGLWAWLRRPAAAAPSGSSLPARQLTLLEVEQLAQHTVAAGGYDVEPSMLVAMAWIESSFDPRAVGDGGRSLGLMQVQASTAEDITRRLGGRGYSAPDDLFDPALSMDLAARYVQWLRTWNGVRRPDSWVVQAYNGGPGTAAAGGNAATRRHLCRWQHTVAAYLAGQTLPNIAKLPC
jgi:soluble lytic murein transglycosylase-like protein